MKRIKLAVEKRKILGKKLKKLRKENILPANIYGKGIKSLSVQLPYKEFVKAFKEVGETGLIDVEVDGQTRPSLIHNIQYDHLNHLALHADFYQVDLKTKVKTMVPVKITGEAKAVLDKLGLLLTPVSSIEVEALPEALPENIEVNVEHLTAVGDQIIISDIKTADGIIILNDKAQVVAKIGELISREAQAQAAAEATAAEAAKAQTAATTAETPTAEGQATTKEEPKATGEEPKAQTAAKPQEKAQK